MTDRVLFENGKTVESLTISELVGLRRADRLLLPPIQRSLVWTNTQIINYWDSLLRGYPAGMMLVHWAKQDKGEAAPVGRKIGGMTALARDDHLQLFDGQQRLTSIMLGLGEGEWKDSRKLWIDFGQDPSDKSGLKFQLRMSSLGQPFGYKPEKPDQKLELSKRQKKWEKWGDRNNREAFKRVLG